MKLFTFLSITVLLAKGDCKARLQKRNGDVRKFPDGFKFGAATASYQIEGAWDEDGKSENIWDHLTHTNRSAISDLTNGDIAADSYHLYKRDVEMMRELGLDHYRFSISWCRILPSGFTNQVNELGIQYYNNLINEMLKYNITPMATIFHWDHPQRLQDLGGWANAEIIDWYTDYARIVFENFGDRVKHWITVNEPREICYQGIGYVTKAPMLNSTGVGEYLCARNVLIAHAKAYKMYDEEFRPHQNGVIGITLSAQWYEPATEQDEEAASDCRQFEFGIYAHPIFSESGDFPPIMKQKIAAKSAAQGFTRSRLPEFTAEEVDLIRGSSDFFGLNHYTTRLVYRNESVNGLHPIPSHYDDMDVQTFTDGEWEAAASSFLKVVPWGFYKLLTQIREDYNNPEVIVTENGYSNYGGLNDDNRVSYIKTYLTSLLDALEEGSNISTYTYWSLIDNFEWMDGLSERFGLYEVDYTVPECTRTPRKSAFLYKQILRTRTLDLNYEPDTDIMTIDEGH